MGEFTRKCINIIIIILSFLLLCLVLIGSIFAIYYYALYDEYFWLLENSTDEVFMTCMGISLLSCLVEACYSLYVTDQLALFFKNDRQKALEILDNSEHMNTFCVKILKGIVILLSLITFGFALYDYVTIEPLFHSRGILKSLQMYKSKPQVKQSLDRLQIHYECCGHLSYTNWTDLNVIMEPGPTDEQDRILRFIPFSCCNKSAMRPCVYELVHSPHPSINYEFPRDLTINDRGCSVVMKENMETIIQSIAYITGLICLIEILTLVGFFLI